MPMSLVYLKDFYKVSHVNQYPPGTSLVFNNFTPRKSRMDGVKGSIFLGLTYFIEKYLINSEKGIYGYEKVMNECLGQSGDTKEMAILFNYIQQQKDLPIAIYALPEGSFVPEKVPALVMFNTHPDFFWLPNMLETILSCTLWGACTSATTAWRFRNLLDSFAQDTSDISEFVDYQAHDFSFRGMFGLEAAMISGSAHLLYFKGTDTIPAIIHNHHYYDQPYSSASSVPATEHSVICSYGKENEKETYKRLITQLYPSGIIAIVSDTWSLWNVIDNILPSLKSEIMARDGKVVIRPDSGNPVDILCGHQGEHGRYKGVIERLWKIFGGTVNSKGYKQLDPHIGAIYGDSITYEIAQEILFKLEKLGFASTNIVFGIGSYTYQHVTRDTLGWAMKTTYIEIDGEGVDIYKDPITDDGTKKSHKGLLKVIKNKEGQYECLQGVTWDEFNQYDNQLKRVIVE